jgi:hypothetical protein
LRASFNNKVKKDINGHVNRYSYQICGAEESQEISEYVTHPFMTARRDNPFFAEQTPGNIHLHMLELFPQTEGTESE